MLKKVLTLTSLIAMVSLATACSGMKETLGVGRHSPDEFTVVKRAPLTLPPEYGLRPPEGGSVISTSDVPEKTKTILLGPQEQHTTAGNAEELLLEKMGATYADSNVREELQKDNGYLAIENQSVADKLIFWEDEVPLENAPSSVIDAKAEAERLRKNAAEGAPVNSGNVPVIEKKKGTIDKFF